MSSEDEKGLREHFAPVGRSLKRTVTSRSMQAYTVSFVDIVVLSVSIGVATIGAYVTFQENFAEFVDELSESEVPNDSLCA